MSKVYDTNGYHLFSRHSSKKQSYEEICSYFLWTTCLKNADAIELVSFDNQLISLLDNYDDIFFVDYPWAQLISHTQYQEALAMNEAYDLNKAIGGLAIQSENDNIKSRRRL